jgi:hypothetical protein
MQAFANQQHTPLVREVQSLIEEMSMLFMDRTSFQF